MRHAILLPPSKGQVAGGGGTPWIPGDEPIDRSRAALMQGLVRAMKGSDASEIEGLLGARGDTLDAARVSNLAVASSGTMAAIDRFDGVLYRELDRRSLPVSARRRLDRSVLIFNALHGVSAARASLPAFRLGFDASLDGFGRLATWWRPIITTELTTRLAGSVVWDLLPAEHAAAWDPSRVPFRRRILVRFVDARGRTVSHWNKLLKGAFVAHLAREGFEDPAVLESFTHPSGYRFDPDTTVVDGATTTYVMRAGS